MLVGFIRWLFANHWPLVLVGLFLGGVVVLATTALVGAVSIVLGLGLAALVGVEVILLEALGIGLAFLAVLHVLTALVL